MGLCSQSDPSTLLEWSGDGLTRAKTSQSRAKCCDYSFKGTQDWDFFCFDFEIRNISLIITVCQNIKILQKNFFDWASIGGRWIFPRIPKTTRNEKKFWGRSKKYFLFFIYEPFIWANTSFSEIWSINWSIMRWSWSKMSKFIPLSLRLSGIEFSLVSDLAESSLA
jgi:hypothetical protein